MRNLAGAALRVWREKLDPLHHFSEAENAALDKAAGYIRPIRRGDVLVREGDRQKAAVLILDGLACRYKLMAAGQRQIISLLLPGDLCDGRELLSDSMDHSIGSLASGRAAFLPHWVLGEIAATSPRVANALRWSAAVDEAIGREWVVNLGGRRAEARIAHLLCELGVRFDAVGLAQNNAYRLPMTQQDLADATGLSVVHVNRILKRLRDEGLIDVRGGRMSLHEPAELARFAEFNPQYLHLRRPPGLFDAPSRRSSAG